MLPITTVAIFLSHRKQRNVQLCSLTSLAGVEIRTCPCTAPDHCCLLWGAGVFHAAQSVTLDLGCILVILLGRLVACWKEWFTTRGIQKP